jgi:hypothetical protein
MRASWEIPGSPWWWANWACNPPAAHTGALAALLKQYGHAARAKQP